MGEIKKEIESPHNITVFTVPNNELWEDPGKKCKWCSCWFSCSYDMDQHLKAYGQRPHSGNLDPERLKWRKSDYDNGEIAPAETDPSIVQAVKLNGKLDMGNYTYTLSKNGKWLKRTRKRIV